MDKRQSPILTWVKGVVWKKLGLMLLSLVLSTVVGGIILALLGYDAVETYRVIVSKAFSDFGQVLRRSTPLMMCALAVAIPIQCGMFNLGGQGQLISGAFAAALVGFSFQNCPPVLHPILAILAAMFVGGLFGLLPALFKVRFGASEIVVTLMFNYVILYAAEYLTLYRFRGSETSPRTEYVAESAKIPMVNGGPWGYALVIAVIM